MKKTQPVTEGTAEQGCKNGHIWYANVTYEKGQWILNYEFDGFCPQCGEHDCPYSEVISVGAKHIC